MKIIFQLCRQEGFDSIKITTAYRYFFTTLLTVRYVARPAYQKLFIIYYTDMTQSKIMLMSIDVAPIHVSIFMMNTPMQLYVRYILYNLCIICEYVPPFTEDWQNVMLFPQPGEFCFLGIINDFVLSYDKINDIIWSNIRINFIEVYQVNSRFDLIVYNHMNALSVVQASFAVIIFILHNRILY